MTVIASIIDNGTIWMASDQQSSGWVKLIHESFKVFRNGDFLIGVSGSVRISNLLRHSFEPPKRHPDVDAEKFMATEFVNTMRASGTYLTNICAGGDTYLRSPAGPWAAVLACLR